MSNKHRFCSFCGYPLKIDYEKEDWGMLGKDDFEEEKDLFSSAFFGGFSGSMLNKMLGSAMKMLEKEMSKTKPQTRTNIRLMINGKEINLNGDSRMPDKRITKELPSSSFSKENLKKFATLPKKEPLTNIRRLSDKVIYEIKMPGIKSIKDVSIIKLENSIEIKALAKNQAYFKLISINLPITNYEITKGKLVLELEAK